MLTSLFKCMMNLSVWLSAAPPEPQKPGLMNNGSRDVSRDIQKLQQQLQDIKDQVSVADWQQ